MRSFIIKSTNRLFLVSKEFHLQDPSSTSSDVSLETLPFIVIECLSLSRRPLIFTWLSEVTQISSSTPGQLVQPANHVGIIRRQVVPGPRIFHHVEKKRLIFVSLFKKRVSVKSFKGYKKFPTATANGL